MVINFQNQFGKSTGTVGFFSKYSFHNKQIEFSVLLEKHPKLEFDSNIVQQNCHSEIPLCLGHSEFIHFEQLPVRFQTKMRPAEFLLLLFTFASRNLQPVQSFNEDCWTKGACLESVMINANQANDPLTCENFCKNLADCSWFTHYEDQGLCVALAGCEKLGSYPGAISGQSKCSGSPVCSRPGRCTGILVGVR